MVNSYGQKPMEKPWIITHGDFMEFFCKGIAEDADIDLFCKMTRSNHCAHSLNLVKSCTHYVRHEELTYLGVI